MSNYTHHAIYLGNLWDKQLRPAFTHSWRYGSHERIRSKLAMRQKVGTEEYRRGTHYYQTLGLTGAQPHRLQRLGSTHSVFCSDFISGFQVLGDIHIPIVFFMVGILCPQELCPSQMCPGHGGSGFLVFRGFFASRTSATTFPFCSSSCCFCFPLKHRCQTQGPILACLVILSGPQELLRLHFPEGKLNWL